MVTGFWLFVIAVLFLPPAILIAVDVWRALGNIAAAWGSSRASLVASSLLVVAAIGLAAAALTFFVFSA